MYGNDEYHDTDASNFKHHLIRGTENRDKIGHELTYRSPDFQVFKSCDQRTEAKSAIDRTNGLVEGNTKAGNIQMTNYKEMFQYKPGEKVVPSGPK